MLSMLYEMGKENFILQRPHGINNIEAYTAKKRHQDLNNITLLRLYVGLPN